MDSVPLVPGVVEMGVGGKHGTLRKDKMVCFCRRLATRLILLAETGQYEQKAAVIIVYVHRYIGFPVAMLAFSWSCGEELNVISKRCSRISSQVHLREQFNRSVQADIIGSGRI